MVYPLFIGSQLCLFIKFGILPPNKEFLNCAALSLRCAPPSPTATCIRNFSRKQRTFSTVACVLQPLIPHNRGAPCPRRSQKLVASCTGSAHTFCASCSASQPLCARNRTEAFLPEANQTRNNDVRVSIAILTINSACANSVQFRRVLVR